MLFSLHGNEFQIKFVRAGDETRAILSEFDASGNLYQLMHGKSMRKHNDIFNKSFGRKRALANLLKKMNETFVDAYKTTKEDRKMIWEIYFKEHKK